MGWGSSPHAGLGDVAVSARGTRVVSSDASWHGQPNLTVDAKTMEGLMYIGIHKGWQHGAEEEEDGRAQVWEDPADQ